MKNISKYLQPILLLFIAVSLATVAAYFSVTGLGKLFAGAKNEVMVMAAILELAKIVCASWLHKNWTEKSIGRMLKVYITTGVVVLMFITSAGIYGFLSNAYFDTSSKLGKIDIEISLLEKQRIVYDLKINSSNQTKKSKNDRIQILTSLRTQQETRIDSMYNRRMYSAVKRTESQIKEANKEIEKLLEESDGIDKVIQQQNDSIAKIELKKADLGNSDIAAEVGPLKYIAKITDTPMDNVINWFILALIVVFDPLAISILIASQSSMDSVNKIPKSNKVEKKIEDEISVIYDVVDDVVDDVVNDGVNDGVNDVVNDAVNDVEKNKDVEIKEKIIPEKVIEFFETKQESENNFKKKVDNLNNKSQKKEEEISSTEEVVEEIIPIEEAVEEIVSTEDIVVIEQESLNKKEEEIFEYLKLLNILFKGGEVKQGDEIMPYKQFLVEIKKNNLIYTDKLIRDFLSTCNLVKAIDTSNNKRIATKGFEKAKEILKEIVTP